MLISVQYVCLNFIRLPVKKLSNTTAQSDFAYGTSTPTPTPTNKRQEVLLTIVALPRIV